MDANAVILELLHNNIIDRGDQRTIAANTNPTQQSQFLHLILKEKCTEDAFETVCDIITAVKGNPKMKVLGESMKKRLETGGYACVWGEGEGDCVHGCMWLCLCMRVLCAVCMDVCVAEYFSQSLLQSVSFALQLHSLQTCPQCRHPPAPKVELPLLTRDPLQRWRHCLQHNKVCSMQCHYTRVHLTVYRVWEMCLCVIVCLCVGRTDPSPVLKITIWLC